MPSSSSLLIGDDALPRADRGVEIVALLVVDQRDAHEVGALLVRRRRPCSARLSSAATRSSQRCWLSRMPIRASSAGQIGRIAVDAALPQRQRAVGVAERLGELGGLAEDRGARGVVGLEVRLALEDGEALLRPVGLRVERGEPARDDELLVLGGAADRRRLDEQLDRALGVVQALEPRARGLGEQLDLARRIARRARAAAATPSA